jgi:hypothetical protein
LRIFSVPATIERAKRSSPLLPVAAISTATEKIRMDWQEIGYAIACIAVPVLWGLVIVWVSNRVDRRLLRGDHTRDRKVHPVEYHI